MPEPAVLRRFSASATRYDAHAHAQRLSARDLLAFTRRLLPEGFGPGRRVLEPGCGTGLYTRMLLDAFPGAAIAGVDFSEAMVRVARGRIRDPRVRFEVADAEEIVSGTYDLVTSNATFQWFLSFPRTVARMASLVGPDGLLTFSFFGPGTYAELDEALMEAAGEGGAPSGTRVAATGFLGRDEIAAVLSSAFNRWDVVERRYHQEYPSLSDLLRSIRYTGTRGNGAPWGVTPRRLARVEEAYRKRHGGIRATYQVLLCRGQAAGGGAG